MNTNTERRHHHHTNNPNHNHRHHLRLSVPPRSTIPTTTTTTSNRSYPSYPIPSSTSLQSPFPFSPSSSNLTSSTPSKRRLSSFALSSSSSSSSSSSYSSLSSLFLLLFSLRSLYSLLPFLRSTPPSFSLFPFSFLVSLFSLLLTATFSSSSSDPHHPFSLKSLKTLALPSILRHLSAKSLLLALVFLLRFQALRSCGTASTILVDFSGFVAAKSLSENEPYGSGGGGRRVRKVRGFVALGIAVFLLSYSWDRIGCSPLSRTVSSNQPGDEECLRVLPMLLPFLSGFLGYFEWSSTNWVALRQLGRKRVRLFSLAFTTAMLFFPALVSFLLEEDRGGEVSIVNLGWPLVNTVIFGVVLSENYGEEKSMPGSKDLNREFLVTFVCTLVLELFYFPKLSLPGFLLCGFLLWISIYQLSSYSSVYFKLGSSAPSESLYSMIRNPIRQILSERKSCKIALFLLINTAYMVVEFVAGFMSNSLGLISDACHMLFDCAALAIGLYASYISRLPANSQFNYGRGRFEVLSGYVNAVLLVLVGALIVLESLERILDPQEISTNSLLTVSIGGLLVNVVGLVFFHEEHHHAHGGGGSCSHSHSHPHSHSQSHSHSHAHHHHSHDHVVHGQTHDSNHSLGNMVIHETSNGSSCDGHDHCCSSHGDHHHHHNHDHREGNSRDDKNAGENAGYSHHPSHTLKHDHHDDCHHSHDADGHGYRNSKEAEHMHHSCGTPLSSSHSHDEKTRDDNGCCTHQDPLNISVISNGSHYHSSQPGDASTEQKPKEVQHKHRHIDHNMEGIFLHVLADTMGSVGVVISTLLIKYKGWLAADPACSIFISVMIISSVLPLLRNSGEILLQRVSRAHEEDLKVAMDDVMKVEGICDVQNLHVWNFTNTEVVGTLHLHVSAGTDMDSAKKKVSHIFHDVGIKDLTIQVQMKN